MTSAARSAEQDRTPTATQEAGVAVAARCRAPQRGEGDIAAPEPEPEMESGPVWPRPVSTRILGKIHAGRG